VVQRADLMMYEEKRVHYANQTVGGSNQD
jgi:hypothetical protein